MENAGKEGFVAVVVTAAAVCGGISNKIPPRGWKGG